MSDHRDQQGVVLEQQPELTLVEISRACEVQVEWVIELVDEGILEPIGGERPAWVFTGSQLQRTRVAWRLHSELGLNLAGVAVALQLLEQIEGLEARLRSLSPM